MAKKKEPGPPKGWTWHWHRCDTCGKEFAHYADTRICEPRCPECQFTADADIITARRQEEAIGGQP